MIILDMNNEMVALDMSKGSMVLGMDRELVVFGMNMQGIKMEIFTKFPLLFAPVLDRQDQKMMVLDMSKEMMVLDRWNMEH